MRIPPVDDDHGIPSLRRRFIRHERGRRQRRTMGDEEMWNTDSEGVCIQEGVIGFGWHILAFGDGVGTADTLRSIVLSMGEYILL